jgi:hypothetical protein
MRRLPVTSNMRLFGRKARLIVALIFVALVILGLSAGRNTPSVLAAPLASSAPARLANQNVYFFMPMQNSGDEWGEITIAQPKVWQYERVNALLDGLLRDVEGISVADLTRLDPSQQNAAAIRFVQSALGVAVTYDQAAQVTNRNNLQNWQLLHQSQVQQLDAYNGYMQQLTRQRSELTDQLFAANKEVLVLQTVKNPSEDQKQQLTAAQNRASSLQTQLNSVNDTISKTSAPALTSSSNVTGTSAAAPTPPAEPALGDLLKSLPESVQKSIANALQSPTYPATKQLDNFITLLYERLAREISVMQDDLMRDPDTFAYLVQFDVGLYPSVKSKNHMARVQFRVSDCDGCKVYTLYPGQGSYNVAAYQGSSKRRSFVGNVLTLIGLGISANYQRQEDALKGSLVQSVYISGFQDDQTQRFGWYYNPAPFDQLVTPGIRSTFAIVTVPRHAVEDAAAKKVGPSIPFPLKLEVSGTWPKRDKPAEHEHAIARTISVNLPATKDLVELPPAVTDDSRGLHVLRMEYNTNRYRKPDQDKAYANSPGATPAAAALTSAMSAPASSSASATGCKKEDCATVLISLDVPIDPNLVITVHGMPLHRVRDWRGRATSVLPPVQSLSDIGQQPQGISAPKSETVTSRSLLETDQLEPNSWYAVNSHDLLLTISRDLAGEEIFPVIQISDPGKRTLVIPNDLRQSFTEIIFDGFRFLPATEQAIRHYVKNNFGRGAAEKTAEEDASQAASQVRSSAPLQGGAYPYSTFTPLFQPESPAQKFYAFVGQTGEDLIIGFQKQRGEDADDSPAYSFLEARTAVVLEDADIDLAWSLSCANQGDELVCKLPMDAIKASYNELVKDCPQNSCPSIRGLVQSLRAQPTDKELSSSAAFIPNLQVWVGQSDPEGKNSFWSPEPTKLGLFPIGNSFTQSRTFKPWHFYGARTTATTIGLAACNYFAGATAASRIGYLTPLDFPIPPPNLDLKQDHDCASIVLPTLVLRRPEVVVQMTTGNVINWTASIATTLLKPGFGKPEVVPIYDEANGAGHQQYRIQGWDLRIPVTRMLCTDRPDFSDDLLKAIRAGFKDQPGTGYEWLNGSTPMQLPTPGPDGTCPENWWTTQFTSRIQLHVRLPKSALRLLPRESHLLRSTAPIATLPDLRRLLLPSKLKVVSSGETQFALFGRNAGAIDAVALQNGQQGYMLPAGSGTDFVVVNVVVQKAHGSTEALAPGAYAIIALFGEGNNYVPIDVTDEQGKALTYTVAAKKGPAAAEKEPPEPDETVVITKTKTTKPTAPAIPKTAK